MTDTLDHIDTRETLWVTDAELIRRLGVPEKIARQTLREVDRNPRLPWPAPACNDPGCLVLAQVALETFAGKIAQP